MKLTYLEALAAHYPELTVYSYDRGLTYEGLNFEPGVVAPSKQELDNIIDTDTKKKVWMKIQEERDRRKSNGVKVGDYWFHSDSPSRIQQLGLVMLGSNMPTGLMWKTMSGTFVEMTPQLAQEIFQATTVLDISVFSKAEYHRQVMEASPEPENYNYLIGWPLTYGE